MPRISIRHYSADNVQHLIQHGIHPVLARIYAARGLVNAQELSHEFSALVPPSGLLHIATAATFLADAITKQKKLVIVADYDCDGATACAVAIRGLRAMGAHVDYIVPNRFEFGYGLTPQIVELTAHQKSPDIIITVDNGIASIDGVEEAKRLGIDVLITDHHLPGDTLPDAKIIVNPNQPDCGFPSKHLAGVGVMFYVLLALRHELRQRGIFTLQTQPRLDDLLDLVALGTVADVVKLDANNRILVAQGLKRIRAERMQPGMAALFRVAGREARRATSTDLGFTLGPRLNAAGRLADMSLGIECLITQDSQHAGVLAQQLDAINRERRTIEADMHDTALYILETLNPHRQATLCIFDDSWHAGVIGIIASRLKDKFHRPSITFASAENGYLRGSGRSIAGFHLRDALDLISKQHPTLIDKFGGHAMAAGLTIRKEALTCFVKAFEDVGQQWLSTHQLDRVIETDGALEETHFTPTFVELINNQVWGQGFAPPVFCDTFNVVSQRVLKEKHLKLLLEKNGRSYDAIWFGCTQAVSHPATIAYRLDVNEYNGEKRVQLIVEYA